MHTCFFIGHRDAPSTLQPMLDETVDHLWRKCGVAQFVVGHHSNFAQMAVCAVNKAKLCDPELHAYILTETYTPHSTIYLPDYFDEYNMPNDIEDVHPRYAIEKANRIMPRECDYLVCYVKRSAGNAAKILRSAKRQERYGLRIINLGIDVFSPKNGPDDSE